MIPDSIALLSRLKSQCIQPKDEHPDDTARAWEMLMECNIAEKLTPGELEHGYRAWLRKSPCYRPRYGEWLAACRPAKALAHAEALDSAPDPVESPEARDRWLPILEAARMDTTVSDRTFETYFSTARATRLEGDRLTLWSPSEGAARFLEGPAKRIAEPLGVVVVVTWPGTAIALRT